MKPLVTVIMPVFNGVEYLETALLSVLQQGLAELELIVIDDGSNDGTAELLATYMTSLTVITQANQGAPAARNAGLRAASGSYVAFIDADDVWTAGRMQRQLAFMRENPAVELIQERLQSFRLKGSAWVVEGEPFHALSLSAALFRRGLFDRVGPLDESMPYCDDVDWFLRAQKAGIRPRRLGDVALLYRRHPGNLTNRSAQVEHYTLRALLKHQRAQGSGLP